MKWNYEFIAWVLPENMGSPPSGCLSTFGLGWVPEMVRNVQRGRAESIGLKVPEHSRQKIN
jgi:hypothetical protein